MGTLYRRELPESSIAFSSPAGRQIFAEALAAGGLQGYFALAEQHHTQSDPAFCGLGSLVVALNALAIDPGRLWKGPWRWFSEELLDCCVSLDEVRTHGVDLETLACLARCNRADVAVSHPGPTEEALRADVKLVSEGTGRVLIASYDRAALAQTGAGHFSPIGGYHQARDLVLMLDVARFKYPPHWIPLRALDAAMRTTDHSSGQQRGWLVLSATKGDAGVAFSLSCQDSSWRDLASKFSQLAHSPRAPDTELDALASDLVPLSAYYTIRECGTCQCE
jgi:glutathione gamma-glutamylcysteinyltransferase